ncbi:uncharacterized protein [Prorops nasuta]|uniref:uncharacterized protein n=1 Tax=Prorops nasuta TaxID=863751 RepID=UPI0034CFE0E1
MTGAVHSGIGCTALQKILACVDILNISAKVYKRYEREIGLSIEETARESCKRAALEERKLVIEKIETINNLLPESIISELYPNLGCLRSTINELPVSPHMNEISEPFNTAIGNIINIIVSYDMGWSRRGNVRTYDSLNGYGTIIGFLSGKILDYRTKNRKCLLCDLGHCKEDHDCRQNFEGSAKSMEAHVGANLINNSDILKNAGLKVRVFIGDEDSSTAAAVRKNQLYDIAKAFKELNKKGAILHFKKCFAYAISQNKNKISQLANAICTIPDHFFNQHENCGTWCKRDNTNIHTIKFSDVNLYNKLKEICIKYAKNASKFSTGASSQSNESVNNIIAHKATKNICLSRSASCDFRVASAVCTKNDGESSILKIKHKICLSPRKYTASYTAKYDKIRYQRAEKINSRAYKLRRIELSQKREKLRKRNEKDEGISYQSNLGIDKYVLEGKSLNNCNYMFNLMYFGLKTSGLHLAKSTKVTGLNINAGEIYFIDKRIETVKLTNALIELHAFLKLSEKPNILVSHNASFDIPRLLQAIINCNLEFSDVTNGFTDTLSILAHDIIEVSEPKMMHEALFDVKILQNLVTFVKKENEIVNLSKAYEHYLLKFKESEKLKEQLKNLNPLRNSVSRHLLQKIARQDITYDFLKEIFKCRGEAGFSTLLTENLDNNKPRVTKDKNAIKKIIDNLRFNVI